MDKIEEAKKDLLKAFEAFIKVLDKDKEPEGFDWKDAFEASGHEWILSSDGIPMPLSSFSELQPTFFKLGFTFRTKEAAKKEAKRREVITKIKILAGDQSWIDWKDFVQKKYYVYFDHKRDKWNGGYHCRGEKTFMMPYFKTDDSVQVAIEALGEELNILL